MRLPRLRSPLPFGSGRRIVLLYVLYTAVLFAVFLLQTFPHEIIVRRLLDAVNSDEVSVSVDSAAFAWHRGYALSGMRVQNAALPGTAPVLECQRAWVRPALGELVRGNPYALFVEADLYGGIAEAELSLNDGTVAGSLDARDLRLGLYQMLNGLLDEGELTGRLSATVAFEATGPRYQARQGVGEVHLQGAGLKAGKVSGFPVPDISFRRADLKFTLRNERLEVAEFTATGEELNVSATGQIVLREPLDNSVLNLEATLQPGLAASDALKAMISLIPRPQGAAPDAPLKITGTLSRPRLR